MSDSPPIPDLEASSDLDQVRNLILASHTDLVPELVQGDSITNLVASIQPARAAFIRVIESVPVTIPAGGNTPVVLDTDSLPTSEKIRRGLAAPNRKD